jgi:hypothetical protein
MARLRDRREAAGRLRPVALLVVLAALPGVGLATAVLATAHEGAQDVPAAEPAARAGLERRQTLPPTPPIPPILEVSAALRGGAQWVLNPPRARADVFGFGALDAVVVLRPAPNVTLLADVETVVGPGPDAALGSLSLVNEESRRLFGNDTRVFMREAWIGCSPTTPRSGSTSASWTSRTTSTATSSRRTRRGSS